MSKWDNLATWWADGVSVADIGLLVGASCDAVMAAAFRRGLRRPRETIWNEENIIELRTLWLDGVRVQYIADRLGTTKNAVIAKADRLGLPTHARSPKGAGGRRR